MSGSLTKRQYEVFDAIEGFMRKNRYAPSFEDIKQMCGLRALSTVHKHLTYLERKHFIRRDHQRARGIQIIPAHRRGIEQSCPKCGHIL